MRGPPPWEVVAADALLEFDAATIMHIQFAQHYVGVACTKGLRLSLYACVSYRLPNVARMAADHLRS